jgi:hypothetical protein
MVQSPCLAGNSGSVGREILRLLLNPKIRFLVTRSLATGRHPEPAKSDARPHTLSFGKTPF